MDHSKRRSHARVPAGVKVTVHGPDGTTTSTEQLTNISLGGVFLDMNDPLPFGVEVDLEFSLPERRSIRCKGLVVWSSNSGESSREHTDGRRGIGVRLMEIGVTDMRLLADFIERNLRIE